MPLNQLHVAYQTRKTICVITKQLTIELHGDRKNAYTKSVEHDKCL